MPAGAILDFAFLFGRRSIELPVNAQTLFLRRIEYFEYDGVKLIKIRKAGTHEKIKVCEK